MPSHDQFAAKLRELGYQHHAETKTSHCWKRETHYVYVPKKRLRDDWVRPTLRQAGLTDEQITAYLCHCRS